MTDCRSILTNSLNKVDYYQSSGQVVSTEDMINRITLMRTNCMNMINQLQQDAAYELQEEMSISQKYCLSSMIIVAILLSRFIVNM